jgi:hypothetical protein
MRLGTKWGDVSEGVIVEVANGGVEETVQCMISAPRLHIAGIRRYGFFRPDSALFGKSYG